MRLNPVMLAILILLLPLMVFLTVLMFPSGQAATDSDTVEIAVNVSELCKINVTPSSLNWTAVTPGTADVVQTLDVKNSGSTNVSDIYASVDTESSRPYGQGTGSYEAGAFLVMHNSTESTYYFVDRREWNESSQPSGSTVAANSISWGYFRNTSSDFFWSLVPNQTSYKCNESNTQLVMSSTADDEDLSDDSDICASLTEGTSGAACISNSAPLNGYCIFLNRSCDYIQIYKFDYSISPTCSNRAYLKDTTLQSDQTETLSVNVWVPSAIPAGDVSNSTLTITATCG